MSAGGRACDFPEKSVEEELVNRHFGKTNTAEAGFDRLLNVDEAAAILGLRPTILRQRVCRVFNQHRASLVGRRACWQLITNREDAEDR
jgi:hypothetical protein